MARQQWKVAPGSVVGSDSPFALDPATWYAINAYVYSGTQLPSVPEKDINSAYSAIRRHTQKWRDETFNKTLTVADNIVYYGTSAPDLYRGLEKAGKRMEAAADGSPEYRAAKAFFIKVCNRLAGEADAHAASARDVKKLVEDFRDETKNDRAVIKPLQTKYAADYSTESAANLKLVAEIEKAQNDINSLQDEYHHAKVVAATTPTYVFLWPFGTIAAAIVAGIYGDKAVKLLNELNRTRQKLSELQAEQLQRATTLVALNLAKNSLNGIEALMQPAIDALGEASACWEKIAGKIGDVRTLVAGMTSGFGLDFADIPKAIDDWKLIAEKADAYRVHAHIQIQPAAAAA